MKKLHIFWGFLQDLHFLHNLVVGKPTITSGKLILRYLAVDIALLNPVRFFHLGVLNHRGSKNKTFL